jgi:phage shock protein C
MNGNTRLYRSTSDAMLGGVAAGLGNYFHVDPTIIRIAFLLAMLFSGGAFVLLYLALWLLMPTPGSTATQPNQIIQENMNEMGAKFRSFTKGAANPTNGGMASNGDPVSNSGANPGAASTPPYGPSQAQVQVPQYTASANRYRQGANPTWLIIIGVFFLLANFGFFRMIHWAMWWPVLLIGLGVLILSRRNQP